jgi:Ala-tRNA(Pro) deacylase
VWISPRCARPAERRRCLASELEFKQQFPDCDAGAMPPFGNLYGMDVLVDEGVVKQSRIAFNAGSHDEVMRLAHEDFGRLVRPKILRLDDRIW